jgi:glycerol-3-phosphate acyltransferase PlsY
MEEIPAPLGQALHSRQKASDAGSYQQLFEKEGKSHGIRLEGWETRASQAKRWERGTKENRRFGTILQSLLAGDHERRISGFGPSRPVVIRGTFPGMTGFILLAIVLFAYLIGSIPFGYLVARWRGIDIFREGSGNIGATNVGRVLGRRLGILVFLLDFAKGALPVLAARALVGGSEIEDALPARTAEGMAALAAFLGHLFPVYLRFRGGKGVATGAGALTVLMPIPALIALLTWIGILCAFRYVSLASMAAVAALCIFQFATPKPYARDNVIMTLFCFLAAGLVLLRHRSNLARLAHGSENRIRDSALMHLFSKTVHVLALGLWLGTVFFFTFVMAPTIFHRMELLGTHAEERQREAWFPYSAAFPERDAPLDGHKEQGTRAAGYAISSLFPIFFALQGVFGFLATMTALGWARAEPARKVHKARVALLIAALFTVVIGWPLEQHVDQLRKPRHETVERFLGTEKGSALENEAREGAVAAKNSFFFWHMLSLGLDVATFALIAIALALAAQLPETGGPSGLK